MSAPALCHCAMLALAILGPGLAWLGEEGDERLAAIIGACAAIIVVAAVLVGTYDPTVAFVGCP